MAKKWSEVLTSPEYQKLNETKRWEVKNQYFDNVVTPEALKKHSDTELPAIRGTFFNTNYNKFDPTDIGLGFGEKLKRSWRTGQDIVGLGQIRGIQLFEGRTSPEMDQYIKNTKSKMARERVEPKNLFETFTLSAAQLLPLMIESTKRGIKTGAVTSTGFMAITAIAGQAGPQALLPEEIVTVPASGILGFGIGMASGAAKFMMYVEGGLAYDELMDAGVEDNISKPIASAVGGVNAALEMAQVGLILKTIPGVKGLIAGKGLRISSVAIAKNPLVRKLGLRIAAYLGFGLTETAQELAQELTTIVGVELGKKINNELNKTNLPATTKAEIAERLVETAKGSAGLWLLGLPGTSVSVATDIVNRNKQVQADVAIIASEGIKEVEAAEKLAKKAPITEVKAAEEFTTELEGFEGEAKVEIPVANAVRELFDEGLVSSGFHKKLNRKWTLVFKGRVSAEVQKAARDAGLNVSFRIAPVGSDQILTDIWASSIKELEFEKATAIFNKFAKNFNPEAVLQEYALPTEISVEKPTEIVKPTEEVIPADLEPLAKEARKYKTAEEFYKSMSTTDKEIFTQEKINIGEDISFGSIKAKGMTKQEWRENIFKPAITDFYNKATAKIEPAKVVKEVKEPVETFTQKLQKIEQEFKTVKARTKAEIKLVQTEIIEGLEASDLEATDKAKFIRTIKNIQTQQQLIKQLPIIQERIATLETKAQIRKTESQIKKELKRTKPLKVGQRRVGKYDYESNKLFETLRKYNKLTQDKAQAELDAYSDELVSESDLIKKRFLSLKANGATASLEIHNAVLNDILRMKAMGLQAKGEIEFYKLIDRQDRIDEVLTNMEKIKADKKTIKTKIGNVYRRGFSNIYSMMNSIFGKDVAEKYDPEINESDRNTAVSIRTRAMADKASTIYDEKNIMRKFTEMATKDYSITDFEKLTTEISKLEIIDIYNSIKNEKKAADYYTSYSKGQVLSLINNLTAEDVEFADYLQDTVQEYRKILNQRNIEITGRDLGTVENYWPATSEFQVSVIDDIRIQGETPSAMKERAKGKVIPVPKNAWFKAQRHVAQAEHIANLSREYETLKRLLSDRKVKHEIKSKFGEDVYRTLMDQIENISLNAQIGKIDAVSNLFGKAINNWVTAKIAIPNVNVFVRQLMSMGNYVENMNPIEWVNGFADGISSPKKTFDYMWKNAPFLKERFNKGYSEAVREAISGAEKINATWGSYTKFLTAMVRTGDITAIIYGGYPLVKAEMAKGKTLKEAIRTFEKATLKAQQSGLASSRSEFQNSKNPFTRLFLAFKNTSNQYLRKMADAVISYQNKDISVEQFAKTMTIYAVIQPILYTLSGFATKLALKKLGKLLRGDDEPEDWEKLGEELADSVITQLAVSPVNAVPLLDGLITLAMRKATGQKIYKAFSMPLIDDLSTGIRKLGKKEITAKDWLTITASILEPTTALPAKTPIRYYKYLMGNDKKSTRRSFQERARRVIR